ncbi:hypothetical protein ACFWHF_14440 [Streptomyces griseoincarnatus]
MARIQPNLTAAEYKTYQIVAPLASHWRPATCEEVDCPAYTGGWVSRIDEQSELGQKQAHYIRKQAGRKFSEDRQPDGLTAFTFPPGQACFQQHQKRLERPELYVVRDGDWRGNPLGTAPRTHSRPDHWVEDFAEHQERLARIIEKG